jgi:hypothetical protein
MNGIHAPNAMMGAVRRRKSKARVVGNIKDKGGGMKDEINGLAVCF